MNRVHSIIRYFLTAILVASAYWNIWTFTNNVADLPSRDSNDVVVQEDRYRGIPAALLRAGYGKGPVLFVTNRTLQSQPETGHDDYRWGLAQYAMVPWILVSKGSAVGHSVPGVDSPFIIGDFWDGAPVAIPSNFVQLYDSGKGVVLFQKKVLP